MSGFTGWTVAVSFATGLVCAVPSDGAQAQDMWPMDTLEPPATAPLAVMPAQPVVAVTPPVAPIKPAALIPAAQQSAEPPLDQLVAPIALYPDPLLGQVLMASTYPQEVAEAARWVRVPANRAVGGEALTSALKAKGWNPSVMALVPFPGLLAIMAAKLDWTERLGSAFLAQQGEVMTAVQHLRHAALIAGNLKATPQCHCIIRTGGGIISIQPDEAELVSVPVYNPAVAYGNWQEAAYPPTEFPIPPGFIPTPGSVVGFNPATEVALFGPIWGWGSVDWTNRRILVDEPRYAALQSGRVAFAGSVWVHETLPPRKIAHNAPSVATHHGHHAKTAAQKRLVLTHSPPPPAYWWDPRYRGWGPPPGAILPPPPPRHIARNWYDGYYYDPYR